MENEKYYVYIYLDPTKKGLFSYGDYNFDYEPFYVGKGYKERCNEHIWESRLKIPSFKTNKIKKILSLGLTPMILKVSENLFEVDAFELEKKLITVIGRRDLKTGPLTNLTDGGEGFSGLIKTEIHRERLRQSNLGKKMSKEAREKISKSLIGKRGRNTGNKHSEETKKQISETKKGTLSWNATPVLQLTKNDELVKEWVSATAAAKELGLSQGNIWTVINGGRNTCGGFKWKLK
jgi:group I intron endonuclease